MATKPKPRSSAVFIQTITDPAERKRRLDRLFRILSRREEAATNSATLTGSELAAAEAPITKNDNQPPETSPADS